jgi:hypothetical protein
MLSSDNDKKDQSLNNKLENLCFIYLFKKSKSNKVLYISYFFTFEPNLTLSDITNSAAHLLMSFNFFYIS